MEKVKISIVVPMYNSEDYIERCIKSLMVQTLKEIEIVIVNDGSIDKSLKIVNNLAKIDERIKVFNKENGGVSTARNLGIEKSNGAYITFVDSDDWCEKDMLEKMYLSILENDIDLVVVGYSMDNYKGKESFKNVIEENVISRDKNEIGEILYKVNLSYLVTKLYKNEIIKKNNLKFEVGLSLGEDAIFVYEYIKNIKSIAVVNQSLYHYVRCNNQSLSTKYVENINVFIEKIYDLKQELFTKFPSYEYRCKINGENRKFDSTNIYIYNMYKKDCPLNGKKRREVIREIMKDKELNLIINNINKKGILDRLFIILYKIQSPLIMDIVYSGRKILVNYLSIFKGIKK